MRTHIEQTKFGCFNASFLLAFLCLAPLGERVE